MILYTWRYILLQGKIYLLCAACRYVVKNMKSLAVACTRDQDYTEFVFLSVG